MKNVLKGGVRTVAFRIKMRGEGIVNFDSSDQKYVNNSIKNRLQGQHHENVLYGKKNHYGGDYKNKTGSSCMKQAIFSRIIPVQSPIVAQNDELLNSFIAHPANVLKGYMFVTKGKTTVGRKSPLMIGQMEVCNDAMSTMELNSKSGLKDSNSLFYKETLGKAEYEGISFIDLDELQFMSCDQMFDRFNFNSDHFELYKEFMNLHMDFDNELDYYQMSSSVYNIPEFGFKFTDEQVNFMVKLFLGELLQLNIQRRDAYAEVYSVEMKTISDPIRDRISDDEGWVEIDADSIESLNLTTYPCYVLSNDEQTLLRREKAIEFQEIEKARIAAEKKKEEEAKAKKKKEKVKEV